MIRPATLSDMPEVLDLLRELHALHKRPLPFDPGHCAGAVASAIANRWCVLVVDLGGVCGLLIASAGPTTICPEPVAVEHAWIVRIPGWGRKLVAAYEAWAREQGCVAVHLSTVPGDVRLESILVRSGYAEAERAYVRAI